MNIIYTFNKTRENSEGKQEDYKIVFRQPNREEREDIQVYHSAVQFRMIKRGMPSAAMISKMHEDSTGGVLSQKQEEEYLSLQIKYKDCREKLIQLATENKPKKKKEEETYKLSDQMSEITKRMIDLETLRSSIYNNTAEIYARNKTIEYVLLSFSMWGKKEEGEEGEFELEDIFEGDGIDEKYKSFDKLTEGADEFFNEILQNLTLVSTWFYQGRAETQEEFDELLALSEDDLIDSEVEAVNKKVEEEEAKKKVAKKKTAKKKSAKKKSTAKKEDAESEDE